MPRPIRLSIDCTKINKALMKNGKYLNCVVWPNRDGADKWGNTHVIKQDVPREQQGAESKIIGNAKFPGEEDERRPSAPPPQRRPPAAQDPDLDQPEDDIPF
jgi:hypothetical protein